MKRASLPPAERKVLSSRASERVSVSRSQVPGHELQNALLLILALYASLILLDFHAHLSAMLEQWQAVVEFLANGLFG